MATPKEITKPKRGKDAAAGDDTETPDVQTEAVLERMCKDAKFDFEKLIGSVGDFILQDLRATRELKSWAKMSQKEQETVVDRVEKQSRTIVLRVVEAIAARGLKHMEGQMESGGSFKEGFFTVKVSVPMTEKNAMLLIDGGPHNVQLVFANAREFESAMTAKPEPDEPPLPGVVAEKKQEAKQSDEATASAPAPAM